MSRFRTAHLSPKKLAVVQREFIARYGSLAHNVYLVNEYPKCGGSWLRNMLAELLGVPPWSVDAPAWRSTVLHAHWLKPRGKCKTVILFRDGRDVMVSYYYHSFFVNEFHNAKFTTYMRNKFRFADYDNIEDNLLPFMKVMFDTPISPKFSWDQFVRNWVPQPDTLSCRYEDLRENPEKELVRLYQGLTNQDIPLDDAKKVAENHTIEKTRQRALLNASQKPDRSFIRSGKSGGWRDHFSKDALIWFEGRAGAELELLGYPVGRDASQI